MFALDAGDIAADFIDDEVLVLGVVPEFEGHARVEALRGVVVGVAESCDDADGGAVCVAEVDAEPEEPFGLEGAAVFGLCEEPDAAAADVEEGGFCSGSNDGEREGFGFFALDAVGADASGDGVVASLGVDGADGILDGLGGLDDEERVELDFGESESDGRYAIEVSTLAALDLVGHGETEAHHRATAGDGDGFDGVDGGAEHPAVLADGDDGDDFLAGIELDFASEDGGLFNEDGIVAEVHDADAPDEVAELGFLVLFRAGEFAVGEVARQGDFEGAAALVEVLEAATPVLGSRTGCRHDVSPPCGWVARWHRWARGPEGHGLPLERFGVIGRDLQ